MIVYIHTIVPIDIYQWIVIMLYPGLAYSLLANIAPIYGLYTSFMPVLVYSVFGSSRHLSVGEWEESVSDGLCLLCIWVLPCFVSSLALYPPLLCILPCFVSFLLWLAFPFQLVWMCVSGWANVFVGGWIGVCVVWVDMCACVFVWREVLKLIS